MAELTKETRIRSMIARHPSCLRVLLAHGWAGCGGPEGPDETLEFFARAHELDPGAFLAELEKECHHGGPAPVAAKKEPSAAIPFALAAILATLTGGSLLGVVNLIRIQGLFAPVSPALKQLHALFQLVGFFGLFTCGVALHALPQFWKIAPAPKWLRRSILALMVGGLLARTGSLIPGVPEAPGMALLFLGSLLFFWWVAGARFRSSRPTRPLDVILVTGAGWLAVGLGLWTGGVLWLDEPSLAGWVAGLEEVLLHGFILSWILGMAPKVLGAFTPLGHPQCASAPVMVALLTSGVLMRLAGWLAGGTPLLLGAGGLLTASAFLVAATGTDPVRRPRATLTGVPGTTGAAGTVIVLWMTLGALVQLASAVALLTGGAPVHGLLLDAGRHSWALGFAMGALFSVSFKIVPNFSGRPLPFPRLTAPAIFLLNAGVAARWAQAGAAAGHPGLLIISSVSGLITYLAILLWAANILGLALPDVSTRSRNPATDRTAPFTPGPGSRVSDILAHCPGSLEILLEEGFGPLANPVLRSALGPLVTLEGACRLHKIPVDRVLERLSRGCAPGRDGAHGGTSPDPGRASAEPPGSPPPQTRAGNG